MLTQAQCAYIAEPGKITNVATGAVTQIPSTKRPIVEAALAMKALPGPKVVGVKGVHAEGFSINMGSGKASDISFPGGPVKNLTIAGIAQGASVGTVSIWHQKGEVDEFLLQDLTVHANLSNLYSVIVAHDDLKKHGALRFRNLVCIDDTGGSKAKWGINGDNPAMYEFTNIWGAGFGEHLIYAHNPLNGSIAQNCFATNCGRTGIQWVTRDIVNIPGNKTVGNTEAAKPGDLLKIINNTLADCGSFADVNNPGKYVGNGSALTVAGFPGDVLIQGNTVTQSHEGGGLAICWHDVKQGQHLSAGGRAHGKVTFEGNTFNGYAGPKGKTQTRTLVMLGSCDTIEWHQNNVIDGVEKELVLDHTGTSGVTKFYMSAGAKVSDTPWIKKRPPAVYREVAKTAVGLTTAQLDALGVVFP